MISGSDHSPKAGDKTTEAVWRVIRICGLSGHPPLTGDRLIHDHPLHDITCEEQYPKPNGQKLLTALPSQDQPLAGATGAYSYEDS